MKTASLDTSNQFTQVLAGMRQDSIALLIKNDPLLRTYRECLTVKHGHDANRLVYVRSRLRELGRLLSELRSLDRERLKFEDFLEPSCFPLFLSAAKRLSGFNTVKNSFKPPLHLHR